MRVPTFRMSGLILVSVSLIGLVGCGGGDDDDAPAAPAATATKSGAATEPTKAGATVAAQPTVAGKVTVPAGAPVIDQADLAFKPDKLTVKAGVPLYFTNTEAVIHAVTIDGKEIAKTMQKGDVVAWTPPKAGSFKVGCLYHPQMTATVTVQ